MKPRNILYVVRAVDGGAAVVANQMARGLDRDLYEPVVLFVNNIQSHIRQLLVESDIKTIQLTKSRPEHFSYSPKSGKSRNIGGWLESHFGKRAGNAYFSLKALYQFLRREVPKIRLFVRVIRENRIDLVHTHSNLHKSKPEIIAARITGVPCISHPHGYRKLTYFDKIFSIFVDMFIYISRDVSEYQIAQGIPRHKGITIHNGIEISEFARPYDPSYVRKEFNIKPDVILIGIIGRIDWWKGQEYFLKAMAKVAKDISGVKGIIIGGLEKDFNINRNRQYLIDLKSLVTSLSLDEKIIFTGPRGDVPCLMSALDIVVHASSTPEPFGLVVIEAMAAGKPVVATAAGGVLDIIEDGVNGLLVPCKDSQAMAQAILQIISDREKAEQMALAARRHVAKKFTLQHQVTAIQGLYNTILGATPEIIIV